MAKSPNLFQNLIEHISDKLQRPTQQIKVEKIDEKKIYIFSKVWVRNLQLKETY